MNNFNVPAVKDGQAPARRIGALIAFFVVLCSCVCAIGVWAIFARESIDILQTSLYLQNNGVSTTGTIVSLEKHSGSRPSSGPTFKWIVEFEADGKTYTVKSYLSYGALASFEIGDPREVRYDPANPENAQIDTFEERWMYPITSILP